MSCHEMCSNRPSRVFRVNRLGYSHSSAPVFLGIELTFTGVMPSPPIEASLVAQMVKNLPAVLQETQVLSMGQEDPLEEEMTTHSIILPWKTLWTEGPRGLHCSPWGCRESDMAEQLSTHAR